MEIKNITGADTVPERTIVSKPEGYSHNAPEQKIEREKVQEDNKGKTVDNYA